MDIPAPSFATIQIKLQVRVGLGDIDDVLKRGGVKRRPPQIGVDDDPGGVDDPP